MSHEVEQLNLPEEPIPAKQRIIRGLSKAIFSPESGYLWRRSPGGVAISTEEVGFCNAYVCAAVVPCEDGPLGYVRFDMGGKYRCGQNICEQEMQLRVALELDSILHGLTPEEIGHVAQSHCGTTLSRTIGKLNPVTLCVMLQNWAIRPGPEPEYMFDLIHHQSVDSISAAALLYGSGPFRIGRAA